MGLVFHVAQLPCLSLSLLHLAVLSNIIILLSAKEKFFFIYLNVCLAPVNYASCILPKLSSL